MASLEEVIATSGDDPSEFDGRGFLKALAFDRGEWAGIPMPLDDFPLRVEDRYPFKGIERLGNTREHECRDEDVDESVILRNSWWSRRRGGWVHIFQKDGKIEHFLEPRWQSAERLNYWLNTVGASLAWDVAAESEALGKLAELVRPNIMAMYMLTGCMLETSQRSQVTYLFRRNRPTIALAPVRRGDDEANMRAIAVLCLHPIAYYEGTWAGAMVPTDDVIAHLLMMRGDEPLFWRRANHHHPESAEAGL